MATDYDAPRHPVETDDGADSVIALKTRQTGTSTELVDEADPFEAELALPGADLSEEDLTVRVLPRQADEFTCSQCFLVHHRSQLHDAATGTCRDCAA